MADYECCGGYPHHKAECRGIVQAGERKASSTKNSMLDALYAEYGKLVVLAERTSHNTRMAYHDKADGMLIAIKIIEEMT